MLNDILFLNQVETKNKKVLLRLDLNVPIDNGVILNDARIRAVLPTLRYLLGNDAKILIISHLGRPIAEEYDTRFSLKPVAERLSALLGRTVQLAGNWPGVVDFSDEDILIAENVRFLKGETDNDTKLAQAMAESFDIFCTDAFATCHRAHASTVGVAHFSSITCGGFLIEKELTALEQANQQAKKPVLAIIGGSKISTKLGVLRHLLPKLDVLILGGGIANNILAAMGYQIGQSLYEKDFLCESKALLAEVKAHEVDLLLPSDVIIAPSILATQESSCCAVLDVPSNSMILDIGNNTVEQYKASINSAATIILNGPVGVFEQVAFSNGTKSVYQAVADNPGYSLAGGGDTIAALELFNMSSKISYISTAGGALLEYLEGKSLPGLEVLNKSFSSLAQT